MSKSLAEAFGVLDIQPASSDEAPVLDGGDLVNIDTDYRTARRNHHVILTKGMAALSDLATIAAETKQPQCYIALTNLAKALAEINGDLLDLTERRSRMRKEGDKPVKDGTRAADYGSTQDILKRHFAS